MHAECMRYLINIRAMFPSYFKSKYVLEIGSQNINGSPRPLFKKKEYLGIDVGPGKGVNKVGNGCTWRGKYNTIITTETAEHDANWQCTFQNCIDILTPGGALIFTCAGEGRPEHGTTRTDTFSSPYTTDYYQNVTPKMIKLLPNFEKAWRWYRFSVNTQSHDTQFFGIKAGGSGPVFNPNILTVIYFHFYMFFLLRVKDYKNAWIRLKKKLKL